MTPESTRAAVGRSGVILSTVLEVVYECAYDQLRMQDVADRAGVGFSTIYRRWPTKQDVVRASLECERAKEKSVVTGDGAQTLLRFLSSMRSDPEVADVFRDTVIARMHNHMRHLLASELGEDLPDLDLRAAAGPAILVHQSAVCGHPVDADAMADRLTELLFAPPLP